MQLSLIQIQKLNWFRCKEESELIIEKFKLKKIEISLTIELDGDCSNHLRKIQITINSITQIINKYKKKNPTNIDSNELLQSLFSLSLEWEKSSFPSNLGSLLQQQTYIYWYNPFIYNLQNCPSLESTLHLHKTCRNHIYFTSSALTM